MSFLRSAVLVMALLLGACSNTPAPDQPPAITPEFFGVTVNPQYTPTPVPPTPEPTPTPNLLAAKVNGQPITLDEFHAEMARYIVASPGSPDPAGEQGQQLAAQLKDSVLNALVEQTLIEQEAAANNISINDQQVDDEILVAKERAGGDEKYQAWLAVNHLTEQDARDIARRELLANAMRDRVLIQLPRTAEYVHVYHIVVGTEKEAEQILAKLQNGAKFNALAVSESIDASTRADGGDLGWIARDGAGVLWSEVEQAALALKPGETSAIVPSPIGYHIMRVTERETRALTEADAAHMQAQALAQWMAQLLSKAKVERYV